MRDGLIEDLRKQVQMKHFFGEAEAEHTKLMEEAADELEKFQKESVAHRSGWLRPNSIFLSGNVAKQIAETNKEREAKGLPPL